MAPSVLVGGKLLLSPATSSTSGFFLSQGKNPLKRHWVWDETSWLTQPRMVYWELCVSKSLTPPRLCIGDLQKTVSKVAVAVAFFLAGGGVVEWEATHLGGLSHPSIHQQRWYFRVLSTGFGAGMQEWVKPSLCLRGALTLVRMKDIKKWFWSST